MELLEIYKLAIQELYNKLDKEVRYLKLYPNNKVTEFRVRQYKNKIDCLHEKIMKCERKMQKTYKMVGDMLN